MNLRSTCRARRASLSPPATSVGHAAAFFASLILALIGLRPGNAADEHRRADASDTPAVREPAFKDALFFGNGDLLYGTLVSIDAQKGIRWQRPDVSQPMDFTVAGISEVELSERPDPMAGAVKTCEIRFTNDDELTGSLISCDEEKAILETWYAGRINIPRNRVRIIRPVPPIRPPVYAGPTGLEGWTLGKVINAALAEPGQWKYKNQAFYATRSASVARDLKLPDVASIQFDLAWKGFFYLAVALYTDYMQPVNLATKENEPDFGGFYSLQINSFSANLVPIKKHDPLRYLGQVPVPPFNQKNYAHLDIRINKAKRSIAFFVDGGLIKEWVDSEPFVGEGTGVRFVHQGQGAVRLSHLQVAEWDGQYEEKGAPSAPATQDLAKLRNGDKVLGHLEIVQPDKITMAIPGPKPVQLEIPMARVKQIELAAQNADRAAPGAAEVKAFFRQSGRITFRLEKWDDEVVLGTGANFGQITMKSAALARIQFHLRAEDNPGER